MSEPQAPFIPPAPDRDPIPPAPWRVFRVPGFVPLFGAQFISSLGDWTGLFAIIAIAGRVSNSATAVGFVMIARMLPGFLFAPVGGALIEECFPFGPRLGCLANISAFGNGDRLDIGIVVDPNAIPDSQLLVECLATAFKAYAPEAESATQRRRTTTRPSS